MRERPIIFSAEMVRALLAGEKTQTRRLAWREFPDPEVLVGRDGRNMRIVRNEDDGSVAHVSKPTSWQTVAPGDRLWVREALTCVGDGVWRWRADNVGLGTRGAAAAAWAAKESRGVVPSIHMPRWASRLTLTVTAARTERLREISHADAVAEGVGVFPKSMSAQKRFAEVWSALHGVASWEANPEVVVICFEVRRANAVAKRAA